MGGIKEIFGKDALKEAEKKNIFFLSLDKIEKNKNNPFAKMNEEEIETSFADGIEEQGLMVPLTVIDRKNGKYELISGERRYRTLSFLRDSGRKYSFNGIDITGEAPVIIKEEEYEDEEKQRRTEMYAMVQANRSRDLKKEDKEEIVFTMITNLYQEIEDGTIDEKKIGKKKEWLVEKTGYAEHFCKDCLAKYNKAMKEDELGGNIEEAEEKEQEYNASKELKKAKNKLHKTADWMSNVDWQAMLQECSEDEVQSLKLAFNAIAEQVLILQKTIKDFSK